MLTMRQFCSWHQVEQESFSGYLRINWNTMHQELSCPSKDPSKQLGAEVHHQVIVPLLRLANIALFKPHLQLEG